MLRHAGSIMVRVSDRQSSTAEIRPASFVVDLGFECDHQLIQLRQLRLVELIVGSTDTHPALIVSPRDGIDRLKPVCSEIQVLPTFLLCGTIDWLQREVKVAEVELAIILAFRRMVM